MNTKKAIIIIAVVVCIGAIFWLKDSAETHDYAANVATEVTNFEALLNQIDASDENTLAGQAVVHHAQIITHLDIINDTIAVAEKWDASAEQEKAIEQSLHELEEIIAEHADTLALIDSHAANTFEDDQQWHSVLKRTEHSMRMLHEHIDGEAADHSEHTEHSKHDDDLHHEEDEDHDDDHSDETME